MSGWGLRLRAAVGKNFLIVAAVIVLLGLGGAYLTYTTHVDPGTETRTVEQASWSATGAYTHQATVVKETDLFQRGDVLEDQSVYFEPIAPKLDSAFVYEYETTGGGGELTVRTTHQVVLRSVGDDGEVFWRTEQPVGSHVAESVGPGDRVEAPLESPLNVTALGARIAELEEQLGGTPGATEIRLHSRVALSGERIGEPVDATRQYEMQIERDGNIHRVVGDDGQTTSNTQTRREEVTATHGPLRSVGAPAVLAAALLGVLGLAVGRSWGAFDVDERERERLAHAAAAAEFEEWISTGRVPDEALPGSRVAVDTLEDLVDVAVDSNRRVIEDTRRGQYLVLVQGVAYTYDAPRGPSEPDPLTSPDSTTDATTEDGADRADQGSTTVQDDS